MSPSIVLDEPLMPGACGTASSRARADSTCPTVSLGVSIEKRWIGSHTAVPASWSAVISTSGVSSRKSPAVEVGDE